MDESFNLEQEKLRYRYRNEKHNKKKSCVCGSNYTEKSEDKHMKSNKHKMYIKAHQT